MRTTVEGIVIRDYKYEENRILTLLTDKLGVITAFANRANRPRSPMAGSTELLCYSDFNLFKSKGNYIVDNADSKRLFFNLRSRFEDLSLASYFAQLCEELGPKEEDGTQLLQLLLGSLHYLENQQRSPVQLKAIMELRALTLAGYMPDLVACETCGEYECAQMGFSYDGKIFCRDCSHNESLENSAELTQGVLAAMRHIIYTDPRKVFAFTLSDDGYKLLGKITENYLLYQIEKSLPTLEFYHSIL